MPPDPRKGRVVELRYCGGLSVAETAEVLGISRSDSYAGKYTMLSVRALQMKLSPALIEKHETADL